MGWGPGGAWELERVFCQFTIDVGLFQSYNTTFCWSWDQSESFQLLAVLAENCGWFKTTLVFQDDHRPTEEQRIPSNSSTSHIPSCYRTFFDPFSRSCVPIHRVANPSTACQHSCAPHPLAIWWKNISKILKICHKFPGGIHGGQSSSRSGLLIDIELLTRLGQVGSGDGNEHWQIFVNNIL